MKWNCHTFCFACSAKAKGETKKQQAGNRIKALSR